MPVNDNYNRRYYIIVSLCFVSTVETNYKFTTYLSTPFTPHRSQQGQYRTTSCIYLRYPDTIGILIQGVIIVALESSTLQLIDFICPI